MHLRDLANVNTNQMIICGGRIDGATTAAQASCDSCATPSRMGATEPRYGEIFAVRSNVRNWPDPEIADRQVRSELTDRYLVDTGQSSAIGRCILNE